MNNPQGVMVGVPESVIQDIAVLKQSQADLRRAFEEGNRNTQQALAKVGGRLDGMNELLQTVTRIAERQESHGNGLDRAFNAIKGIKDELDDHEEDEQSWRDEHTKENARVERKLTLWHGIAIGISITSGLILGVLTLAGNSIVGGIQQSVQKLDTEINRVETQSHNDSLRSDQRLDRLERIEARYHGEQ